MRVKGTEAEQFLRKKKPEPKVKPNNWRAKHEEFISAIRYAKMAGQIEKAGGKRFALALIFKTLDSEFHLLFDLLNRKRS